MPEKIFDNDEKSNAKLNKSFARCLTLIRREIGEPRYCRSSRRRQ